MRLFLIIAFVSFSFLGFSQTNLPYDVGEYAAYKISFGAINVGYAELEVKEITSVNNKPSFHIIGKGRTASFFDWVFKVRDVYETFIDTLTLLPLVFNREVREGRHVISQQYNFNHNNENVVTQDSTFKIPIQTQDMLSAFFYARTFKKDSVLNVGSFYVPIFMDDENYFLEIKYIKNEIINTKWGKVDCMVFQPKMQEGRIFEDGEEMKIWISDDKNHLLLRVETKIWTGLIKAVLQEYKHVKYPLSIIEE